MNKIKLYKECFFKNVAVVTGTSCSGKSMVAPIVSSLSNVEHVRKLLVVDQIFHLANLRKINKETAIFLVRHYLDKSFYEQLIGRNINFRVEDETSIFTAKNTEELINRILIKRGEHIITKHIKNKTIFCLDTRDGIMLYDYWTKVSKGFKFINIYRNPIDTVASWEKHGVGKIEKVRFNEVVLFKNKKNIFPHYYLDKHKDYPKNNSIDRVIDMVMYCQEKEYKNFKKYKKNNNCIFIEFEDFAENTSLNIEKICKFLKTKKSKSTKEIMIRENCPRKINPNLYKEKFKKIKFYASRKKFEKLLNLEKIFVKRKKNLL